MLDILRRSTEWNSSHGITGMLLYVQGKFLNQLEGRFLQVLEGNKAEVTELFESIKRDHRHHQFIVLKQGKLITRNFDGWTMGFNTMELGNCKNFAGYFELDNHFSKYKEMNDSHSALDFLQSFAELQKNRPRPYYKSCS